MERSAIPEKLMDFIREEAKKLGYEIVDITIRSARSASLEIILDKEGGITLDECGDFNRLVMTWIESEKLFGRGYTLDVCSPGLDRELKTSSDFVWATGKEVEVSTHEPVDKKSAIIGKLIESNDAEGVTIEEKSGNKVTIDKANIAKAKLWVSV